MKFIPRKLLFKAWNRETGLLMRLNNIECVRGELFRKDHILLQFTGVSDQQGEELYEMDMVLIGQERYVAIWDAGHNGWSLAPVSGTGKTLPLVGATSAKAVRICNYFESEDSV